MSILNRLDRIIHSGVTRQDNGVQDEHDIKSAWELPFGEKVNGPFVPFGARIDHWIGPKSKLKGPASNPGVSLGYVIQSGFPRRREYVVLHDGKQWRGNSSQARKPSEFPTYQYIRGEFHFSIEGTS